MRPADLGFDRPEGKGNWRNKGEDRHGEVVSDDSCSTLEICTTWNHSTLIELGPEKIGLEAVGIFE